MVILIDTAHRDNTSQDDYMFFVPCRMFHPPLHYYMYIREILPKIYLYSANTTITVLHHYSSKGSYECEQVALLTQPSYERCWGRSYHNEQTAPQ